MPNRVLVVGSSVVDLTFYTARIPSVGETLLGRFAQGLGGKGFNQAVGSALAGSPTSFISALGDDLFAAPFQRRLQELGVSHALETLKGDSTGAAAISVDEAGRNSIIVALGANERLSPSFLAANEKMFDEAAVLLLQFETSLEIVDTALRLARKRNPNVITILNPAPALPKVSSEILSNVDFLTPNESELEAISGCKLSASSFEADVARACAEVPVRGAVLATLGEKGCFHFKRGGESAALPAYRVKAIDTAGAGDAFNGAFASGLLSFGGEWRKAAQFATAAAGLSVTRPGTSASMARKSEIEDFMASGGEQK
jgi:ribokinase